jgi:hypothetical protein
MEKITIDKHIERSEQAIQINNKTTSLGLINSINSAALTRS